MDPGGRRRARRRLADARFEMLELFRVGRPRRRSSTATSASRGLISVAQDDAAQGRADRAGRLAPGRRVHGPGALAQPVAGAVALRRRRARARHRPAAARAPRRRPGPTRRCSTTRSRRPRPRRRPATSPIVRPIFEPGDALFFDEMFLHQTGVGPVDAQPALRDRELVLRRARRSRRTTRRSRPGDGPTRYSHDPARWGASLAHSAELLLPCLDAAGARSVVEVGAYAGDLTRVLVELGAGARARA